MKYFLYFVLRNKNHREAPAVREGDRSATPVRQPEIQLTNHTLGDSDVIKWECTAVVHIPSYWLVQAYSSNYAAAAHRPDGVALCSQTRVNVQSMIGGHIDMAGSLDGI